MSGDGASVVVVVVVVVVGEPPPLVVVVVAFVWVCQVGMRCVFAMPRFRKVSVSRVAFVGSLLCCYELGGTSSFCCHCRCMPM